MSIWRSTRRDSVSSPCRKRNALKGLKAANYEFKIHSSNGKKGVEEIIWGFVGGFSVAPGK